MVDHMTVKQNVRCHAEDSFQRQVPALENTAGFTIVELIVVVAIVAVLALMSIPVFNEYSVRTKNKRCIAELRTIDQAITAYILDKNTLPPTGTGLSEVGMGGLKDPWSQDYVYNNFNDGADPPLRGSFSLQLNSEGYDLYSRGSDGNSDPELDGHVESKDDLVRVNNGSTYVMREEM